MPRKIRPRCDIDPVQEVPEFSFTDAQIEQLFKALPSVKSDREVIKAKLERYARDYFWRLSRHHKTLTRAEQNASLAELIRLARSLRTCLCGIDKDTEWELVLKYPASRSSDFTGVIMDLDDRLDDIQHAAEAALYSGKKKSGPRAPTWLQRTVLDLSNLYETVTGERFTHNPKLKTQYDGSPQSRAGHFIVTFFKIVDRNLAHTRVSTAMAHIVKSRKPPAKSAEN